MVLQAALVGTVARDNTKELILDTLDIPLVQAAIRGAKERALQAERRRTQDDEAAGALQSAFRGFQSRRSAASERAAALGAAACLVQGLLLGRNSRAYVREWLEEDYEYAASVLQGSLQGLAVRSSGVAEMARLDDSAVQITAAVRAAGVRQEAKAFLAALELDSVLTLQSSLVAMDAMRGAGKELSEMENEAASRLQGIWKGRVEGKAIRSEREALWGASGARLRGGMVSTHERRLCQRKRRAYSTKGAVHIQAGMRGRIDRRSVDRESREYYSGLMPAIHSGLGFFSSIGTIPPSSLPPGIASRHRLSPRISSRRVHIW